MTGTCHLKRTASSHPKLPQHREACPSKIHIYAITSPKSPLSQTVFPHLGFWWWLEIYPIPFVSSFFDIRKEYRFLSIGLTALLCGVCLFPHWPQRNTGCGRSKKRNTGVFKLPKGLPPSGRWRKIDYSKVQRSFLADLKTE